MMIFNNKEDGQKTLKFYINFLRLLGICVAKRNSEETSNVQPQISKLSII